MAGKDRLRPGRTVLVKFPENGPPRKQNLITFLAGIWLSVRFSVRR